MPSVPDLSPYRGSVLYVQRLSLWCQSKVDVLRVSDMNRSMFALIYFQVLHLRHTAHLQKLLFEFDTHKTCTGSSTGSQVVSSHPSVGSDCVLPGCGHLLLHGVFQHGARWTLQSNRMILKSWPASRHVVYYKCFFLFLGMFFGFYIRYCCNSGLCNICVHYNCFFLAYG